jgi:hypothetical protein
MYQADVHYNVLASSFLALHIVLETQISESLAVALAEDGKVSSLLRRVRRIFKAPTDSVGSTLVGGTALRQYHSSSERSQRLMIHRKGHRAISRWAAFIARP